MPPRRLNRLQRLHASQNRQAASSQLSSHPSGQPDRQHRQPPDRFQPATHRQRTPPASCQPVRLPSPQPAQAPAYLPAAFCQQRRRSPQVLMASSTPAPSRHVPAHKPGLRQTGPSRQQTPARDQNRQPCPQPLPRIRASRQTQRQLSASAEQGPVPNAKRRCRTAPPFACQNVAGAQALVSMPFSDASSRIFFCSFSKARTSIWRIRSRLTLYWLLSSSSVTA